MTEELIQWDGVSVFFKNEDNLENWTNTKDTDYTDEVKYYCYKCYPKVSLADEVEDADSDTYDHVRHYNRAIWDSYGYPLPVYTAFCSHCDKLLDIRSEFCCINHQTQLAFSVERVLKIMVQQITKEQTLCAYLVLQAVVFSDITRTDVEDIIELGKYHISRFEATPSGLMLLSLER